MTFTDLFVRRPVLALVVSTLILLLGLFSLGKLPIRQYPLLESSTITVTTEYPGASADLMQGFVTQPIAQAVSSVEGIDYLSSTSVQGRSVVTIRMLLNRDSTQAMTETMAKVNSVRYKLPERAYDSVIERSSGETTAVAYVGFSSKTLPIPALTDYLSRVVEPMFSSIDGVAKVQTFGGQRLAMRLWLDADRLAGRGLTASDVAEAIRRNNYQAAPGMVKGQYVLSNVRVNTDLTNVDDFREMVIRNDGNGLVRLRDVGTVELGAAATETSALMDGDPAVHLGLFPTPTGNPLVIVDGIRKLLPEIQKTLPPDVRVDLAYETSRFIQASIDEVVRTLVEALLIVVLVIYLCLGSLRSVLIPVATIPLSMLGAAALMLAFGFSVNLLTLLAMVLAIGLVVDDAIVVVENVHRHIEEGKSPVAAALIGAREVAGPVIAMTITLAAVYTPIGLMGGLTGALFREFALTLAGAVIVSGVVALTLSPVMSSLLLQAHQNEGRMGRAAEWFFGGLTRRYGQVLEFSLGHRWLTGGLALLVCISLPLLYSMPKRELAPTEDQAAVLTAIKAPQHANLDYVELFARKLDQVYTSIPETVSTWIINGTDGPAASFGGINLAAWEKRERDASAIQSELQGKVGDVEGSSIFAFQLAALPGSTGGLPVQMVLRSPQDYPVLYRTMEEIKQKARQSGLFVVVDSDLDYNNPVVQVRIDRAKANSLGIRMQDIGESLAVLVGENYVNRFGMEGRSYDVIPQSLRDQRFTPQALARQFVRTQDGNLVPLSTVVRVALQVEPNKLIQFDQQNAATLQAIPAPGVSMGQAVAFLDDVARGLPAGFSHDWQSDSRQYTQEGNTLVFAFLAALVVIYLVLAAQYESLADPLIILITVPLSICGALLPLALGYATMNIYTQIGLVTLIGLISKHGILMVEFANELQLHERLDRRAAILRAAQIRLRPVLMTTAAMVFGLVPLLFASGAGAASRLGRLSDAALARAEAADADLRLVRLSIAADTARAYFEIQGYQRRLDVARAQVRSWRDTLELTRSSLQLGSGLPEDVENAQANLLRSEAAIPPLATALESARYRLDVLRGEAPGSGAPILDGGGAAPLAKNLPLGDVDRLILQRPDVVSAERQLAASTEDVGAATAELYPRLDLGGFIGFFALRSGDLGSASRAFELAPSVSWPAFRLGNVRARLRAVEAQSDAALARYQRSLLLAQEDVGNALNQLAEHQRRLVALFQSATHGANALEIANERYRAGAGSYLAVLENQRALYQIREELAQAETASFVNVIALYKALGWGSGDLAPGAGQLAAGETAGANR